jgi:hypothetical protein
MTWPSFERSTPVPQKRVWYLQAQGIGLHIKELHCECEQAEPSPDSFISVSVVVGHLDAGFILHVAQRVASGAIDGLATLTPIFNLRQIGAVEAVLALRVNQRLEAGQVGNSGEVGTKGGASVEQQVVTRGGVVDVVFLWSHPSELITIELNLNTSSHLLF